MFPELPSPAAESTQKKEPIEKKLEVLKRFYRVTRHILNEKLDKTFQEAKMNRDAELSLVLARMQLQEIEKKISPQDFDPEIIEKNLNESLDTVMKSELLSSFQIPLIPLYTTQQMFAVGQELLERKDVQNLRDQYSSWWNAAGVLKNFLSGNASYFSKIFSENSEIVSKSTEYIKKPLKDLNNEIEKQWPSSPWRNDLQKKYQEWDLAEKFSNSQLDELVEEVIDPSRLFQLINPSQLWKIVELSRLMKLKNPFVLDDEEKVCKTFGEAFGKLVDKFLPVLFELKEYEIKMGVMKQFLETDRILHENYTAMPPGYSERCESIIQEIFKSSPTQVDELPKNYSELEKWGKSIAEKVSSKSTNSATQLLAQWRMWMELEGNNLVLKPGLSNMSRSGVRNIFDVHPIEEANV